MFQAELEDIATIQVGYQARSKIKEAPDSQFHLIQGKDFDAQGNLCTDTLLAFAPERKTESYLVHKGNILLQSRGAEHTAYCIHDELSNTLAAGSFYIIRIKDKSVTPAYLAWWLNQRPAQAFFETQASGTIMSFVSKSTVSQLKVQIPSLHVQQQIQNIVELGNREQELLNKLAENRAQLVQAACMKALKQ
jgi:hypothetical protein